MGDTTRNSTSHTNASSCHPDVLKLSLGRWEVHGLLSNCCDDQGGQVRWDKRGKCMVAVSSCSALVRVARSWRFSCLSDESPLFDTVLNSMSHLRAFCAAGDGGGCFCFFLWCLW